ncbi:hypothetical protein HK105_200101 [Polyrhizophydium stewartii]|uniref:Uncharacterized protein n=1 Tax=Polyrhizophydium stewartii TaxID=2732419 RepID=A0ABR4NKI2_9FUNG|nr:hypothetical protein HK105_005100 [Polyrhizophydium stewartii]
MTSEKRVRVESVDAAPIQRSDIPVGTQARLTTMGMRVRKSIPAGYQITKKPNTSLFEREVQEQAKQIISQTLVTAPVSVVPMSPKTDAVAGVKRQRDITDFFRSQN